MYDLYAKQTTKQEISSPPATDTSRRFRINQNNVVNRIPSHLSSVEVLRHPLTSLRFTQLQNLNTSGIKYRG